MGSELDDSDLKYFTIRQLISIEVNKHINLIRSNSKSHVQVISDNIIDLKLAFDQTSIIVSRVKESIDTFNNNATEIISIFSERLSIFHRSFKWSSLASNGYGL